MFVMGATQDSKPRRRDTGKPISYSELYQQYMTLCDDVMPSDALKRHRQFMSIFKIDPLKY
jgi:hypothetical protein